MVTENYDDRLRMDDIGVTGLGTVADWAYNGVDRTISAVLGNGIASTFAYDLNDRLTSIQHAKDANDLFHVDYGWDAANRRTFARDLVDSTNSELYTHDARDRLTQFERGTLNALGTAIGTPTPSTYLIQSRDALARAYWHQMENRPAGRPRASNDCYHLEMCIISEAGRQRPGLRVGVAETLLGWRMTCFFDSLRLSWACCSVDVSTRLKRRRKT